MAEGIAAIYVKARLEVTERELDGLIALFRERRTYPEVRVLENGSQEIAFPRSERPDAQEGPVLEFEKEDGRYVCQISCRLVNARLAGALRLAVTKYKGNGLFHRYGDGFMMAYEYRLGTVVKITEVKGGIATVLYQYNAVERELEDLFRRDSVEREIVLLRLEIDRLLDLRTRLGTAEAKRIIDRQLCGLAASLNRLES
ncbi:hypothetical protein [Gorillibacterium sp. sgz500922]|uniref:hypothetical protein n=1 Tax=Gorillibacterium sp. sgz500922 TaxID=3446694 RepID=UPI003F67A037